MTTTSLPLVSLIIPVYNGSDFLRDAIESALAQTYRNLEIIVVNDGSKDDGVTARIAKEYGDRIRYFEKPNGGVASALNLAIRQMRGQFFSWLSHDDIYETNKVEVQVEACLSKGISKRVIVYSDFSMIEASGRVLSSTNHLERFSQEQLTTPMFPLINGLIHGCTLLISRDLFEVSGEFNELLRTTQDYDLWSRMFRHATFIFIPGPLIRARQHPNQGSRTMLCQNREMVDLWSKIYRSISAGEMKAMYGSVTAFYEAALEFERQHLRIPQVFQFLNKGLEQQRGFSAARSFVWRIHFVLMRFRGLCRDFIRGT